MATPTRPKHCAFCATGNHRHCVGECACGERAHVPDVATAAAMRRYQRPDLVALPDEALATQYRQHTGEAA